MTNTAQAAPVTEDLWQEAFEDVSDRFYGRLMGSHEYDLHEEQVFRVMDEILAEREAGDGEE